jgi:hypothetical protein
VSVFDGKGHIVIVLPSHCIKKGEKWKKMEENESI